MTLVEPQLPPAGAAARPRGSGAVPAHSALRARLITSYFRYLLRRNFRGLRLLATSRLPDLGNRPAVIYLNHPSWWDPVVAAVLAERIAPRRRHFAPMDAGGLQKYRFLAKAGLFPVDLGAPRGAAAFLRTSEAIVDDPRNALWITAEGQFTDVRSRPLRLRPGVAHVARRRPEALLIPLAIEYAFWNERFPEVLVSFGKPVAIRAPAGIESTLQELTAALERTQQELAEASVTRESRRFTTLLTGRAGVHPVYDGWRRIIAAVTGRPFRPDHEPGEAPTP